MQTLITLVLTVAAARRHTGRQCRRDRVHRARQGAEAVPASHQRDGWVARPPARPRPVSRLGGRASERRRAEDFDCPCLRRCRVNAVEVHRRRRITLDGGLTREAVEGLAAPGSVQAQHPRLL
jgi:hypothetical protein